MRPGLAYLLEANTPINRDPHYQDEEGLTPMHRAAELGLTTMVRALSTSTCSYAGAITYAGDTPAQLAERAGHTLLAQELSSMASVKVWDVWYLHVFNIFTLIQLPKHLYLDVQFLGLSFL